MPPVVKRNQPLQQSEAQQQQLFVNHQPSLVRPMQDFLNDGLYLSEIVEALIVEINDKQLLKLAVNITDEDGHEQSETFLLKPDFRHPLSSFFKLLDITGCMPERGKPVEVHSLIGQQVMLTLKTVTRNGNNYTNIVDVEAVPDEYGDSANDADGEDNFTE